MTTCCKPTSIRKTWLHLLRSLWQNQITGPTTSKLLQRIWKWPKYSGYASLMFHMSYFYDYTNYFLQANRTMKPSEFHVSSRSYTNATPLLLTIPHSPRMCLTNVRSLLPSTWSRLNTVISWTVRYHTCTTRGRQSSRSRRNWRGRSELNSQKSESSCCNRLIICVWHNVYRDTVNVPSWYQLLSVCDANVSM